MECPKCEADMNRISKIDVEGRESRTAKAYKCPKCGNTKYEEE